MQRGQGRKKQDSCVARRHRGPLQDPLIPGSLDVVDCHQPTASRHVSTRGWHEGAAAASACSGGLASSRKPPKPWRARGGSSRGSRASAAPPPSRGSLADTVSGSCEQLGRAQGMGTHLGPTSLIAAEGCWSCGGRHLIPCPILECYSVTYNRVTRAAADVPDASIGHRNKEGRVPGLGLYNPELCSSVIGSKVPRREGME